MIPKYVTVGGTTLDWVITADGEASHRACGGNAIYSAVGARLWSDRVAVVSVVGCDYPAVYLKEMADAGIDVSGVRRIDRPHGLLFVAKYDQQGNRHLYNPRTAIAGWGSHDDHALDSHRLSQFDPRRITPGTAFDPMPVEVPEAFWQAEAFHQAGMRIAAQGAFARSLHDRSIRCTLDGVLTSNRGQFLEIVRMASAFLPSEVDVVNLLGDVAMEDALNSLSALGPAAVAIKLGRLGSIVHCARTGQRHRIPAYPTAAKDPTGAGDAYCGGFLVGWTETGDALEAALRGTVSASFVIEEFDARYALHVRRADAEQRLSELRATTVRLPTP